MQKDDVAAAFRSYAEAEKVRNEMTGWGRPVIRRINVPDETGWATIPAWIIEVPGHGYLRESGYVN